MAQAVQVYANDVVDNLLIDKSFIISLADISIRDYGKKYGLSSDVHAVDLDAYETSLSGNNDKTIDAAIGIANYINNSVNCPRLLLVELRIDYTKKAKNSTISSMLQKEKHSRQLLSGTPLDSRCFFIFDTDVAPRKKNEIANQKQSNSLLKNWQILSSGDFIKQFYFVSDLPYKPITDVGAISLQGDILLQRKEWEKLFELLFFWFKCTEKYIFTNNREESKAIFEVEYAIFKRIDENDILQASDDVQLNYMILEEDLQKMQKYIC